jgi:hypothetical protein
VRAARQRSSQDAQMSAAMERRITGSAIADGRSSDAHESVHNRFATASS